MSDIRMTADIRTDYDCETTGLPAAHWAEAVFTVDGREIVLEISAEKDIIVAVMVDEKAIWKGTLKGLEKLLADGIKPA